MLVSIRRNKYGKLAFARALAGSLVTEWTPDPAAAGQFEDGAAKQVCEAFEKWLNPNSGQLTVLDAKGKALATVGDPGESPKVVTPPATTIEGLAAEIREVRAEFLDQIRNGLPADVRELRARIELIEEADASGPVAELEKRLSARIDEALTKLEGVMIGKLDQAIAARAAVVAATKTETPLPPPGNKPEVTPDATLNGSKPATTTTKPESSKK